MIPLEERFDSYHGNDLDNEKDEEDFYIYPGYVTRRRKGREPCTYDFVPISGYYYLSLRKLAEMGHPVHSSYLEVESKQGTMTFSMTVGTRFPNLGIIVFTHLWHGFSLHYSKGVEDLLDCKFSLTGLSDKLYRVSNSCDGMVCVGGEKTTYVINPATKEFLKLPSGTPHEKASYDRMARLGLYFDNQTHKYKVVRLYLSTDYGVGCEIFTLGGKTSSWRRIDNPPTAVHADPPIFVNGALHWTIAHNIYEGPGAIMSFDVQTEKFAIIMHPEDGATSEIESMETSDMESLATSDEIESMETSDTESLATSDETESLIILEMERLRMKTTIAVKLLGGHLCLVVKDIDYPDMDIWMLKDYAKKHWVKMYTIDLGTIDGLNREMADFIWPEAIFDNGTILFASLENRLEFYDPQSEVFQKFDIEVEGELHVQAYYTESRVSPHQPFLM